MYCDYFCGLSFTFLVASFNESKLVLVTSLHIYFFEHSFQMETSPGYKVYITLLLLSNSTQ